MGSLRVSAAACIASSVSYLPDCHKSRREALGPYGPGLELVGMINRRPSTSVIQVCHRAAQREDKKCSDAVYQGVSNGNMKHKIDD